MNVLVVGNLYPPYVFGGYEILCAQVVEAFRAKGHSVAVLTSDFRAESGLHAGETGVERSLSLTTPFPRPGEDVGFVDFRLSALNRVAVANMALTAGALSRPPRPYDVVFCWCLNRLSLGPLFAARKAGVPHCYTVNDEHPRQYRVTRGIGSPRKLARRVAEGFVWPYATLRRLPPFPVTTLSHYVKRSLVGQGVPFAHAEVIHQGVPLDRLPFRPLFREPGEPLRVVYVGQLSRNKGVHTVVGALAELSARGVRDVRLDVVGSGVPAYEKELRDICEARGLGGAVRFVGQVPRERVPEFHRASHVLVFSSEWPEPFGLAHLEAMAAGVAVVSTTTGGSAELVRDGENALAYRAGDPADLADGIDRFRADEALRRRVLERARRDVEERFDFNRYVDNMEDFVLRAAAAPS